MSAEYLALLLADGRLPTGAHTQSSGLEPAMRNGMRITDVPQYLTARLRTITEVEASAAVVARHLCLTAAEPRLQLAQVDLAWRVRTLSDAMRDASDLLGRGLARLAMAVWDLDLDPTRPYCRPVVAGAAAAAAGLDGRAVARLIGYDDVQTVIGAALKLAPFDPIDGVRWAVAAAEEVDQMVERVALLTEVTDIPAHSAPLMEAWVQRHATAEKRLYRA